MSTPAPRRRDVRRTHLDASVVPVERALLARADAIAADHGPLRVAARQHGIPSEIADMLADALAIVVASEFRALAEELHFF